MIRARSEVVSVFRWWFRALGGVSCVFQGALLDGGLGPLGANVPGASGPPPPFPWTPFLVNVDVWT